MKKKLVAGLLVAVMAASLMACGNSGSSAPAAEQPAAEAEAEAPAAEAAEQAAEEAPQEEAAEPAAEAAAVNFAAADGTPLELVVAFPTFTGRPADTEIVQEKINEILTDKLGIKVSLEISDFGTYRQNMTLALAGQEQIDVMSSILVGYPSSVTQGYFIDMEENDLMATYGPDIMDTIGADIVDTCRIDGVLYGVPNIRDYGQGKGCISIATEYLDRIGYSYDAEADINHISYEDLMDLMQQLHEAVPEIETFRPATNNLSQFNSFDIIGGNNFGVLENYGEKLEVVDMFQTEEYKEFIHMMNKWNKAGYISKNAVTDTTAVSSLIGAGTLVSYGTGGKPGIKAQESAFGTPVTIFQCKDDFMAASATNGYPWCIPITTVNAEASMALLNEMYTNHELADLFVYGIEGMHYELVDGLLDTAAGSNVGAYNTLAWLYPNQFMCTVTVGNPENLWDICREFNDNCKKSAAMGFSFDTTPVNTEIAACTNVYNEFQNDLEFGFAADPDAKLAEMVDRLKAAGIDTIIAEKQRQLDEWAANK